MITSKCNMACEHCGMNCKKTGTDMSRKVWEAAMKLAADHTEMVTLGGGEPTLHKNFWEIMARCVGTFENVWMATNGSIPEIAIPLARLAKKGVLGVALSQDPYHDPIEEEVIEAFGIKCGQFMREGENDCREIRDTSANLIKAGRCKYGKAGCICADLHIKPNGDIRGCGCKDAPVLGTVFKPNIPDYWQSGECSHDQEHNLVSVDKVWNQNGYILVTHKLPEEVCQE